MTSNESKKPETPPQGQPKPSPDAPAAAPVDVELSDDELGQVSGGFSSFPVQPGKPVIPNP